MTLLHCSLKREVRANLQDGTNSMEMVCLSLVGVLWFLRWFYYWIWKMNWQPFAGLVDMASDHEFFTYAPL